MGGTGVSNVVPIGAPDASETALFEAIEDFLASADLSANTERAYRASLEALADDRGTRPLGRLTRNGIETHLRSRYGELAPATWNRHLTAIGAMCSWAVEVGLLDASPAKGIRRRRQRRGKGAEPAAKVIPIDELEALWTDPAHLVRDRILWRLLYDSAARASEVLGLDIGDLDVGRRRGTVIGKGGDAETIHWTAATAHMLPMLMRTRSLGRRTSGPLFISSRKPPWGGADVASGDLCPHTGHARLGYDAARKAFGAATGGRHLHQLRHSRLTHLAEAGVDAVMLQAIARHSSIRTLQHYLAISADAVGATIDQHSSRSRAR